METRAKIPDAAERDHAPISAPGKSEIKTFSSKHVDPTTTDSVWMESRMLSHGLRALGSRQGGLRDLANPGNLQ
jgi:hypothetical protein